MGERELRKWVNDELTKLLEIDVNSVDDISDYIVSIHNQDELVDFVKELLVGGSNRRDLDGPQKDFVRELMNRCQRVTVPENIIVYKKDDLNQPIRKQKPSKKSDEQKDFFDVAALKESVSDISPGKKSKKTSYVSLYGKDGKIRSNAIILPGRYSCECQAQKHRLINNCLGCGRVVCEQEGSGPCLFCGELVCTREEKEILARKSNKSEKLHKKLTNVLGGGALTKADHESRIVNALDKARAYKERLLNYDRTCAQRTKVIDDEADYYATDSIWINEKERKILKEKEAKSRELRHGSRINKKFTLDFAGRRVVDSTYDEYDITNDADVISANEGDVTSFNGISSEGNVDEGEFPGLINPNIKGHLPTFINTEDDKEVTPRENAWKKNVNRLQDKGLLELSDPGLCLSMHQPWASLLVHGIKLDEGRSWYSGHRGRLWIASAAKQPSTNEISSVEEQHRNEWMSIHQDDVIPEFPAQYPTGCLLGCVQVKEVLSQEEYRISYPLGTSVASYVFVCTNPHQLNMKLPVKGKHKIWQLDPKLHRMAKAGLVL